MAVVCYHCGKAIKGKYKMVTPPKYAEAWGEFAKAYHPKCYKDAEDKAEKELKATAGGIPEKHRAKIEKENARMPKAIRDVMNS